MSSPSAFRTFVQALCVLVIALGSAVGARAGLEDQPAPPAEAVAKIQAAVKDILGTGSLARARPTLYQTVEANIATDVTDLLATVVRDDISYNGLVSTFEEARDKKSGADQRFVAYNLARLHLLRARVLTTASARRGVLAQASEATKLFTRNDPRDPAVWELVGDIAADRGDVEAALAAYRRIGTSGAPAAGAVMELKIATLYHRTNRFDVAAEAYQRGVRAAAASGEAGQELRHRLYQGLAALYLQRGNDPAALSALVQSARVSQNARAPFRLGTEVARRLLQRGHAREVLDYANAALRVTPGDAALTALRDQAQAAARPRR